MSACPTCGGERERILRDNDDARAEAHVANECLDIVCRDVLLALAGWVCTPAEGFRKAGLGWIGYHIREARKLHETTVAERDAALDLATRLKDEAGFIDPPDEAANCVPCLMCGGFRAPGEKCGVHGCDGGLLWSDAKRARDDRNEMKGRLAAACDRIKEWREINAASLTRAEVAEREVAALRASRDRLLAAVDEFFGGSYRACKRDYYICAHPACILARAAEWERA